MKPYCTQNLKGQNSGVFASLRAIALTLYSIITPLQYRVFENIMEKGAFALLEQMLHFP